MLIEDKIKSWPDHDRRRGEVVYRRAGRHVKAALLKAYQVVDPSLTALPPDVLENELRKFAYIAKGDFSPEYFKQQSVITKNLAANLDYATYLSQTYAAYAAGLASGLMKEKKWNESDCDDLMLSLMKSVFSDASVVMYFYFELLTAKADQERAVVEAERARVADEDRQVIEILGEGLSALADCNLTYRITAETPAKSEALKRDFNAAIDRLEQVIGVVSNNAQAIRNGADEMTQTATDLSKRTEQQAASLEETAAALDQITTTVRATADGSQRSSELVNTAQADAQRSGEVVEKAVLAMGEIEKASQQISQITSVIDEIAFQTNLLALNAGVEAARAGEAGRGFAVVATEVRGLAQRSAEAAKEIKILIQNSSHLIEQGVKLVDETGHALKRIAVQVAEISSISSEIAASAKEQAHGLAQVNSAINQMDQFTQQNATVVEESTAASLALAQETEELARAVGVFQVAEIQSPRAAARPRTKPVLKAVG